MDNAQDSTDHLTKLRHSSAHVLAQAVVDLFPTAKLGIGPPIPDGFYYDFDLQNHLTAEDIERVEQHMRDIIATNEPFVRSEISEATARTLFAEQPYKLDLIDGIVSRREDEDGHEQDEATTISSYASGSFVDLCRGPHLTSTAGINPDALKLLHTAAAYWRGDEKRPTLQRVYGTVCDSPEELRAYLALQDEIKLRDHRRIGQELGLFTFSPEVGKGLPIWLPAGTAIRDELEQWAKHTERKWGYQRIATPHITRAELYRTSGHLPYYQDDLYAPIDIEGEAYYLKPMNCPHHHMAFKSEMHSYRDLPIRYAEYGTVYRYERSGQLHGLMRTRGFTQNDAHIYCTFEQAREEFMSVMRMHEQYYDALGLHSIELRVALRDPKHPEKYHGDEEMWETAERITREVADASGFPVADDIGGAAHYGPKLDIVIRSVTGKEFAASTCQLDLYMPKRFELTYIDPSGKAQYVVVLHRAPLGSHERFVAFLTEQFRGAFPAWLAPRQVRVIPIGENFADYARSVRDVLFDDGYRVDLDDSNEAMGKRIRAAEVLKIPYMLVVGRREAESESVSVRLRGGSDLGSLSLGDFRALLQLVVGEKRLALS